MLNSYDWDEAMAMARHVAGSKVTRWLAYTEVTQVNIVSVTEADVRAV